jgi:hypothetical protein
MPLTMQRSEVGDAENVPVASSYCGQNGDAEVDQNVPVASSYCGQNDA